MLLARFLPGLLLLLAGAGMVLPLVVMEASSVRLVDEAMAAKRIHAPRAIIFFETGAIDSKLEEVPMAVGDSRVMFWTAVNGFPSFDRKQRSVSGRPEGPHSTRTLVR